MKNLNGKSRKGRDFYIILTMSICVALVIAGVTTFLVIRRNPDDHQHNYTSTVTKQATCTAVGTIAYTCECGASYTEDLPLLEHDYTSYAFDDSTHWLVCSMCQTQQTDDLTENHDYVSQNTQQVSCTDDGVTTYACKCGYSYTDTQPALGHDVDELLVVSVDDSAHYVQCTRCDKVFARQHSLQDIDCPDNVIATCYRQGHNSQGCSICNYEIHAAISKTDDHNFAGEWQYDSSGHFRSCINGNGLCDAIYREAHDIVINLTEPTCTSDGQEIRACSKCDYADKKVIPGGHNLTHYPAKQATATQDGNVEYWQCSVCKRYFSSVSCDNELQESEIIIPAQNTSVADDIQDLLQLARKEFSENASDDYYVITLIVVFKTAQTVHLGDMSQGNDYIEVQLPTIYNVDTIAVGDVITVKGRLFARSDNVVTLLDATVVSVRNSVANSASIFITCTGATDGVYLIATSSPSGATFSANSYNYNCLTVGVDKYVTFVCRTTNPNVRLLQVIINGKSYSPTDTSWIVAVTGDIDAQFVFG